MFSLKNMRVIFRESWGSESWKRARKCCCYTLSQTSAVLIAAGITSLVAKPLTDELRQNGKDLKKTTEALLTKQEPSATLQRRQLAQAKFAEKARGREGLQTPGLKCKPWIKDTNLETILKDKIWDMANGTTPGMCLVSTPASAGKSQRWLKVLLDKETNAKFAGVICHSFQGDKFDETMPLHEQILKRLEIDFEEGDMPNMHAALSEELRNDPRPVLIVLEQVDSLGVTQPGKKHDEELAEKLKHDVAKMVTMSANDPGQIVYLALSSSPEYSKALNDANGGEKVFLATKRLSNYNLTEEEVTQFLRESMDNDEFDKTDSVLRQAMIKACTSAGVGTCVRIATDFKTSCKLKNSSSASLVSEIEEITKKAECDAAAFDDLYNRK